MELAKIFDLTDSRITQILSNFNTKITKVLEIGMEEDHVHFLVQSVPAMSPKQIVQTIKSITARKIFQICPDVKQKLWGGAFWTAGYYVNTVSRHGNESTISKYVKNQGKSDYEVIHKVNQLELFE